MGGGGQPSLRKIHSLPDQVKKKEETGVGKNRKRLSAKGGKNTPQERSSSCIGIVSQTGMDPEASGFDNQKPGRRGGKGLCPGGSVFSARKHARLREGNHTIPID